MPSSRSDADTLLTALLRAIAISAIALVVLIIGFVVAGSLPALGEISPLRFFTDKGWAPTGGASDGRFDLTAMLAASLACTAGAVVLAAPLAIGAAVFTHYYAANWMRGPFRMLVAVLAGIPSVVFGLWGLESLAPWVRELSPPGTSLATGILVLALMILPTICALSDAALRSVPSAQLDGAAALGLTRWGTVRAVAWPAARPGIAAAVVLGTLRAIGETMAVLMVCGNIVRLPDTVFAPVRTLTANIALELGYATELHRSVLFVSGLVLMAAVVVLVSMQRIAGARSGAPQGARVARIV